MWQEPIKITLERKKMKLIKNLKETDYLAIKHSEGELTDSEYLSTKLQRKRWRDEINELEEQLKKQN